jgi:xanthine/uracil permease
VKISRAHDLLYGLDDRPPGLRLWLYALQFLVFSVANSAIIPIIVGAALGLGDAETATLVQRTFFFCAVGSLLQVSFGHRYPIFEGPAGVWYSVVIALASMAGAVAKPLPTLRTDLELGLIVAGLVTVSLGAFRLMSSVVRLFTPLVNGVFLCVMGLQLSGSLVRGVLGIAPIGGGMVSATSLAVALTTMIVAIGVTFRARGFLGSIGILAGAIAGWIVAALAGAAPSPGWRPDAPFSLPRLFAWGTPTYDIGIILTCVVAGLVVLANLVASVAGMAELTGSESDAHRMNRGAFFTGISDLLGGVGAVIGFIPYASSLGLVSVSRVAARLPFLISTIVLAALALFPLVGEVLAAIPRAVGNAVLLVTFSQVVVLGIKNLARAGADPRTSFVAGVSLMVGVGIGFVPGAALQTVPVWARYLVSNGLLVSTALAIFLQRLSGRTERSEAKSTSGSDLPGPARSQASIVLAKEAEP